MVSHEKTNQQSVPIAPSARKPMAAARISGPEASEMGQNWSDTQRLAKRARKLRNHPPFRPEATWTGEAVRPQTQA